MGTEKGVAAMVCIVKVERNHGKIKVTLDDGRMIKVYDRLAYEKGFDIGKEISDEEIEKYSCK